MSKHPPRPNESSHDDTLRSRLRTTLPSGEAPDYINRIAELRENLASEARPQGVAGVTQDTSARWPRNPLATATIRWVGVATVIILAIVAGTERAMVRSMRNRAPAGQGAQQSTIQTQAQPVDLDAGGDTPDATAAATSKISSPFHVQVGAFNARENAGELLERLQSNGYSGRMVEFSRWPRYRVWVGDFPDRSGAERLAARLQAAGFEASVLSP